MRRAWLCSVALATACTGPAVDAANSQPLTVTVTGSYTTTPTTTATPTTTSSALPSPTAAAPKAIATATRRAVAPVVVPKPVVRATVAAKPATAYYANCTAARQAGAAPLHRGAVGYRAALDRDGDGVACE